MDEAGIKNVDGEPIGTDNQATQEAQTTDSGIPTEQGKPSLKALADEAIAKASRLEQETAKYAKVMKGLGIDPDSDFADKFNQGLVSQEELYEKLNIPTALRASPVEPQLPTAPTTPADKLSEIIARVEQDGASEDDFKDAVSTFRDYISRQEEQRAMSNQELLAQQCERTVVDNLLEDPIHNAMPTDELKLIEQRLFLSSTDSLVGQEARKTSHPERYLNPETYGFYANKNAEDLNKLRDYYKKTGFDAGVAAARGQTPAVQPISPTSSGAPVPVPTTRINSTNMRAAATEYLKNQGKAV